MHSPYRRIQHALHSLHSKAHTDTAKKSAQMGDRESGQTRDRGT